MAQTKEDILIEITVSNEKALNALNKHNAAISDLKDEQKDLQKQLKELSKSDEDYSQKKATLIKQITNNTIATKEEQAAANEYQRVILNNIKIQNEDESSLKAIEARLSNLRLEYSKMSEAQKNSSEVWGNATRSGEDLRKEIEELDKQSKATSAEMGQFQKNVGNYPKVVDLSTKSLRELKAELKGLRNAQAQAVDKTTFAELGKQIHAVEGRIGDLNDAFKTQVGTAMEQTNNGIRLIQEGIVNLDFDKIKIGLGGVKISALAASVGMAALTSAMTLGLSAILQMLPSLSDLIKMFTGVSEAELKAANNHKIYQRELSGILEQEKSRIKAQEDLIKLNNANGKSVEENEKLILKAKQESLEQQKLNTELELANLYILESERGKLNDEEIKRKEEYQNFLINYNSKQQELLNEFNLNQELKQIEAHKKSVENYKDMLAKQLEALHKLQDSQVALMQEGAEKQIKTLELQTEREIETIKKRLETEKNLSVAAKKYLNELIENLQKELHNNTEKINQQAAADRIAKDIEIEKQSILNQLEVIEKGSEEELELKKKLLEKEKKQRVDKIGETLEDIVEIEKVYKKKLQDLENEHAAKVSMAQAKYLRDNFNRSNNMADLEFEMNSRKAKNYEEYYNVLIDYVEQKSLRLQALSDEEIAYIYGNDAEAQMTYRADVEASKDAVVKAEEAKRAAMTATLKKQLQSFQSILNATDEIGQVISASRQREFDIENSQIEHTQEVKLNALNEDLANQKTYDTNYIKSLEDRLKNETLSFDERKKIEKDLTKAKEQSAQKEIELQQKIDTAKKGYDSDNKERQRQQAREMDRLSEYQKALAIFQVGLDTAEAISSVTASTASGDPYSYAFRVAAAIAAVGVSIGKAYAVLNDLNKPVSGYAKGGTIKGGEQVIRVNEMGTETVMNANATKLFSPALQLMNAIGNGEQPTSPMANNFLIEGITNAIKTMPVPVVTVEEINTVNERVKVLEKLK